MACGPGGVRRLMELAYEDLRRGAVSVVVAPTSYGKTAASPWMWGKARGEGVAWGLIHVAPLRSLLRGVYKAFFEPCRGRLQMHGAEEEVKSPYFLSGLVATTLDSFLWNLYRVPVAEALRVQRGVSMGHYYPALLAIYSSIIVMDEAHMYLWEDPASGDPASVGAAASLAAAETLAAAGVPLVVETATVRPSLLGGLSRLAHGREVRVRALRAPSRAARCPYLESLKEALGGGFLGEEPDPEWESGHLVPWRTMVRGSWGEVIEEIVGDASSAPVLVVANTVAEAVGLYKRLEGRGVEAVLVHGRLSAGDRREAEERLARIEGRGGVVVATQVAEAGVDVNSIAVYTAPAPLESLVQRAGRACRRGRVLEECRAGGGKLVIVREASRGPYSGDAVSKTLELVEGVLARGRAIDWRAPCDHDGATSYGSLLASLDTRSPGAPAPGGLLRSRLLRSYLEADVQPRVLSRILDSACGLARDTLMVEVDVGGSTVAVSLEWALRHAGEVLERGPSGAPILLVEPRGGEPVEVEAIELSRKWGARAGCWSLLRAMLSDARRAFASSGLGSSLVGLRLKAKSGAYKPGLGLLLPGEASGV